VLWDGSFNCGCIDTTNIWNGPGTNFIGNHVHAVKDPLGSGQWVGQFDIAPTDVTYSGGKPRGDLESPELISPTQNTNVYVSIPEYVPLSTLSQSGGHGNMIAEVYGPPYGGTPTLGFDIQQANNSTAEQYGFNYNTGNGNAAFPWYSAPITTNSWHTIIAHINMSPNAGTGYVELWFDGQPQQIQGGSTGTAGPGTRLYFATWQTSVNGGSPNFLDDQLYANLSPNTLTEYHGESKIGTTLASVQPAVAPEGP
jgi:Polysaccharide lyase